MLKNIFYPTMFMAAALLMLAMLMVPRALASPSTVTFTVDSVLDQIDDDTSDGICHSAANHCTLRAAIMQANRTSGLGATIIVPAGIYTLTLPAAGLDGEDNGDLNLTTPGSGNPKITITGAGAGSTIIDANQIDRVFHVRSWPRSDLAMSPFAMAIARGQCLWRWNLQRRFADREQCHDLGQSVA